MCVKIREKRISCEETAHNACKKCEIVQDDDIIGEEDKVGGSKKDVDGFSCLASLGYSFTLFSSHRHVFYLPPSSLCFYYYSVVCFDLCMCI